MSRLKWDLCWEHPGDETRSASESWMLRTGLISNSSFEKWPERWLQMAHLKRDLKFEHSGFGFPFRQPLRVSSFRERAVADFWRICAEYCLYHYPHTVTDCCDDRHSEKVSSVARVFKILRKASFIVYRLLFRICRALLRVHRALLDKNLWNMVCTTMGWLRLVGSLKL